MKNFKKIALGLLVGAMAISFSAFTNAHKTTLSSTHRYYSITGTLNDTNPADFVYVYIPEKVYQHSALKVYHVFRMKPYQWLQVYNTLDVCNYYQY